MGAYLLDTPEIQITFMSDQCKTPVLPDGKVPCHTFRKHDFNFQ